MIRKPFLFIVVLLYNTLQQRQSTINVGTNVSTVYIGVNKTAGRISRRDDLTEKYDEDFFDF